MREFLTNSLLSPLSSETDTNPTHHLHELKKFNYKNRIRFKIKSRKELIDIEM